MAAAQAHLDSLTKPVGSLGRLEEVLIWLAGVTGQARPALDQRLVVVAAGDHGVVRHDVSAWPQDVTRQMVANFVAGGAAISALADAAGARVTVVDVGVASDVMPQPERSYAAQGAARLNRLRVGNGTRDFTVGPAMSPDETSKAIRVGRAAIEGLASAGHSIVAIGEMGIGNTTSASAMVAALTGRSATDVTGYGAGIDEAGRQRKIDVIERGLGLNRPDPDAPLDVLAAVGGFEIAALVGLILEASERRIPVILDGFITGAAALVAARLAPGMEARLLAAHRSPEPGHAIVLDSLGLKPLLDLDLRLGEATGAALALLLIDAAIRVRDGMATFDSAGVSGRI